ncbi:MAG TPA: tetratricopeptide repeat protein, partial [Isosphaeraceae bacterium]
MFALIARSRPWSRWLAGLVIVVVALAAVGLRGRVAPPQERWQAIQEAVRQGRWDEAEARLTGWLGDAPGDGHARLMLGGLLGVRGRDDEARAVLGRIPAADAAWPRAQEALGELALKRHDAPGAERAFRAAAARDRRAVEPRRRLVYLLMLQQRSEEARAVLRELYGLDPDPRHLEGLVALALAEPDARDLGPELAQFLARTPDDPWLRRARGLSLLRLGRPAEARPHLEAAAAALEDDPMGRFALAECRLLLGAPATEIDAALGPEPDAPSDRARWWLLRGRAAEARGESERADACWRRAAAADPGDHIAQYRLGQALVRRGEAEAARAHLDRAEVLRTVEAELTAALRPPAGGPRGPEAF